jgi:hypothetical protein
MIRPWGEIRCYFAELAAQDPRLEPMKHLVDQIEASPTLSRLHAWTSMCDLHLVQTPVNYPYDGPQLIIAPTGDGFVDFRYEDTPVRSKQWHRVVPGPAAFARLQRFAEQLHWFAG